MPLLFLVGNIELFISYYAIYLALWFAKQELAFARSSVNSPVSQEIPKRSRWKYQDFTELKVTLSL